MKPLALLKSYINWKYQHYVSFFIWGAGLELFMNLFHVGEASIYRSINRSLSTSRAEKQFEVEKYVFERLEAEEENV